VLGGDEFCCELQKHINPQADIPKRKKVLRHLLLSEIDSGDRGPGEWMGEAYREHGYTMRAIAEYAKLHHSTVSRFIKKGEGVAPKET